MRQIVSKEEEARKKKRNQIILGIILVTVMIASTLSFAFLNQSIINPSSGTGNTGYNTQEKYNGYTFINQNGLWFLGNFSFTYLPQQVININSLVNPFSSYNGKPLYVYSEDQGAEVELTTNMRIFAQRIQDACPAGTACSGNLPLKTCSDNFIIIKEGNSSNIMQQDGCVYITAPKENMTQAVDIFLYKTFGIKK